MFHACSTDCSAKRERDIQKEFKCKIPKNHALDALATKQIEHTALEQTATCIIDGHSKFVWPEKSAGFQLGFCILAVLPTTRCIITMTDRRALHCEIIGH